MSNSIVGAKKKERKPRIAVDSAASISTAKLLYGLAEGEVYGLADGAKSIRLDGTPLVDDNGNGNFNGVRWTFAAGTNDQEHISGFPDVTNEVGVGVELRSDNPWIKAFNDTQLSAVRVRFKWGRLSKTNPDNGDVNGHTIKYAIDLQTDGGAYHEIINTKIQEKTSAGYERTHRIDLPKAKTGWQLRVRRLTPNDPSEYVQDTMMIEAVAEVIDVKLSYPNTALLGIEYNAEIFSSVAKIAVRVKGKIIRVPDNYDPVARTYTGIWTGNFKDAYSNNPAWVFYDLCTQWRGGLGERLDATMIDRWSLYALGQYCDQPVSDGQGGLEPRFTCNVYLQKQEEAYTVLQNIAGIFRAMSFWTGERIMLDADVPQDSIYTYSAANIVGGVAGIQYSGTRNRDRHTLAKVAWDNPNNDYQTEYEYVRDEKAMSKFGVKVLDLSAFGCTSQAQAQRAGLWALKTEQLETRQVTFSVGLDGAIPTVGNIISLSDEAFAGRANGGRVSTVNGTQRIIELDREVVASVGDVLIINGGSGKSERRNISNVVGNRITVTAGFTGAEPEHVWAIETADLKLMRFRVMSIIENDDATYAITAIQHEPQKYDAIDFGTDVKPTEITIINPDTVDAPASVAITSRHREVQGQTVTTLIISWSQVKGAVAYDVEWRKDDGTWIKLPRTGNVSAEIDGVYSGNYLARVRAISAFDVQSQATTSTLTAIEGKIGLPPTVVGLTATGILFGMDLKWGFQQGSGDAAYTEIQVGSAPNVNVATLGQYSYPTNTHTINGLQGNLSQSYRARLVDKLGFKSEWSAWVTGTTDANADKIMDLIQGQIDESAFSNIMKGRIADIEINKEAISQEVLDRIAAITAANDRITDEAAERVEAVRLLAEGQANIEGNALAIVEAISTERQERIDALVAVGDEISLEQQARIDDILDVKTKLSKETSDRIDSTLAIDDKISKESLDRDIAIKEVDTKIDLEAKNRIDSILDLDGKVATERQERIADVLAANESIVAEQQARIADVLAANESITEEQQARIADVLAANESIVAEQQARIADVLAANEGISSEITERKAEDSSIHGRIDTVVSKTDDNIAAIASEIEARTDADGALGKRIDTVVATSEDNTAAITSEVEARTDADSSLGKRIDTVTSVSGDNTAAIQSEIEARTDADSSLSKRIDTVTSVSEDNTAAIKVETTARTDADSALSERITSVVSESENNTAAITEEIAARTSADESLSESISIVSAKTDTNSSTITDVNTTLSNSIGAQAERISIIQADYKPNYADKEHFVDVNRSTQWTYAKTVAQDNYATNQRITVLQSEVQNSAATITQSLETLATKEDATSKLVTHVIAETETNKAAISDEQLARTTAFESLSGRIQTVQSTSEDNAAAIQSEVEARTDEDSALGKRIDTVVATSNENTAAITSEVEARADAFSSLATRIDTVTSVSEDNTAALQLEVIARTDEDSALATRIDTVTSVSEDNTAAIKVETTARTDADSALSERITSVVSESENNTAAITEEIAARTSADESLSESISIVSAKTDTNSSTITDVNTTLSNSIGAQAERISIIQADYKPNYADKEHFVDVNRSTQWTYAKTVAQDNYATNQRITVLQSEVQNSAATITQSLETLATKEDATSKLVTHVIAETETNKAAISDEQLARTTAFESLSGRIQTVQSTSEDNAAAVQEEANARTSAIDSVTQKIVTLTSETDENKAAILQESEARTSAVESVTKTVSTLQTTVGENAVAITTEQQARADDISAVGSRIDSLITGTGENTAAITSEQLARTEEDSALASRIDIMSVEVGNNKAAIVEESEARTNDVESVSKRITTLVSQFDENKAAIDTEIVTLSNEDIAITERIDTLTAASDESNALVISRLTALAEEDLALSNRFDVLFAETGENKAAVVSESLARTTEDEALSKRIDSLVSVTADNQAAVTKETTARTNALVAVAEDISTLTAKTGENEAAIKEESFVRTDENSALSERIVTLTAETGDNKAAIQEESEARTTDIESVTKDITTLISKTDDNEAAITKESATRATDFEALSKDIEVVSSKTDGNTASITALDETLTTEISAQAQTLKFLSSEVSLGFADKTKYADKSRATAWSFAKTLAHADYTNAQMTRGLTADFKDSSARFSENIELLSRQNEATATKTGVLTAQVLGNDYEGGGLGKLNSGLIFEESKARATDVEGLAEQISLLSAGVGEQFDSFEIWHFNRNKEGWSGGTFSGGWIDVKTETLQSPQIEDLDGAIYKHVKLRIKKFGQPVWSGLLTHVGGSKNINEPSYDEEGVALANWQL